MPGELVRTQSDTFTLHNIVCKANIRSNANGYHVYTEPKCKPNRTMPIANPLLLPRRKEFRNLLF